MNGTMCMTFHTHLLRRTVMSDQVVENHRRMQQTIFSLCPWSIEHSMLTFAIYHLLARLLLFCLLLLSPCAALLVIGLSSVGCVSRTPVEKVFIKRSASNAFVTGSLKMIDVSICLG